MDNAPSTTSISAAGQTAPRGTVDSAKLGHVLRRLPSPYQPTIMERRQLLAETLCTLRGQVKTLLPNNRNKQVVCAYIRAVQQNIRRSLDRYPA